MKRHEVTRSTIVCEVGLINHVLLLDEIVQRVFLAVPVKG
jgi:hypothetical protein